MKNIRRIVCISLLLLNFYLNGVCQTDANTPYRGITIYLDYPDVPASVSAVQLDSILNGINYQESGIQRSFRKYWHEQTRRNVVMHQSVFFYTAPKPSTYYDTMGWQNGILLWKDALEKVILNNPSFNWSTLSLNQGGSIKSVMIISSKWGPAGVGGTHFPSWTLSNGIKVNTIYGSVMKAPWDVTNNLFMTLHESGHGIFQLPDTYDTEYNSGGTSFYTLMSGGKSDVEPIGGPFMVQNNWGHIISLGPGTHNLTLNADGDSVVVLRNLHDTLEFFTLEARKKSTIGNSLFPANLGLLVWHSDSKVSTSNTLQDRTPMKHYAHSVEQADGLFELEGNSNIGGNMGDLFLPGNSFNNNTTPNTKWWDNSVSGIDLNNVKLIGTNKISFTVTIPNAHADHYQEIPQSGWSVVSAPVSQVGYEPAKAFDGNVNTYYHIPWGNTFSRPHEMVINLGKVYSINEFYYTANKNNAPPWEGRIENYKIYISSDTLNWGAAVASGTLFQTGFRQYVLFANKAGRYLKFSAFTSFNNDVRTSIAEINLRGFDPTVQSLSKSTSNYDFQIYPNPSKGSVRIQLLNDFAEITVMNMLGQPIIKTYATEKTTGLQLDQNGVYTVYVKTKEGTTTRKLIINK